MIHWVFAGITLAAVLTAALARVTRLAILALWVSGLSIGALYLTLGAEVLAIVQWVVSTLVAISFVFFAVMFGEYRRSDKQWDRRVGAVLVLSVILAVAFPAVIWIGGGSGSHDILLAPAAGNDLIALGRRLEEHHFLALQALAFTLFLALVGGGVIARPEANPDSAGGRRSENSEEGARLS